MEKTSFAVALAAAAGLLAACDNGPSAVAGKAPVAADAAAPTATTAAAEAPTPMIDGRPMWSSTSRYTATENAARAFERNGEAFGASNVDEFVRKAHAFVSDPPQGAETLNRANGDLLIYDPESNVFAVATAEGAPRTMFKPDEGRAYWERQKELEAERAGAD